jgi:alkylhydroperoxidase family enzyme
LNDETLTAMILWRDSVLFDSRDRLVLELAEALTRANQVEDSLYDRLQNCFSRDELVRLTMTIALAGMVNRVHATFETEVDQNPE